MRSNAVQCPCVKCKKKPGCQDGSRCYPFKDYLRALKKRGIKADELRGGNQGAG